MSPLRSIENVRSYSEAPASKRPRPSTPQLLDDERRISFAPNVKVQEYLHLDEYSAEERDLTWYTRSDLAGFKKEAKSAIRTFVMLGHEGATFRGLESRTPHGALRKLQNKEQARWAVFAEQERQWREGYQDPEAIADVYYDYTEHCRANAQMMGLRDEQELFHMVKESLDMAYNHSRIVLKNVVNENRPMPISSAA